MLIKKTGRKALLREIPMEANRSGATRRRARGFVITAALVIGALGGGLYWYQSQAPEPASAGRPAGRPAVPVTVAVAARQDVPVYLTGIGAVQAWFTVKVHSQVDGKLEDVLFTEGQHVKKGDVLATIDPRLFQAALDQAKAKKAQDEALLVAAEKDLTRDKMLITRSAVSEQTLDQQVAKVDQLKASITADEAAIETAQTQLDYTKITAPTDGRIGIRLVDPGNLVHASDAGAIAMLALMQPTAVVFTLPSRVLPEIRAAMARGPVEVSAFDQNNRETLAIGTLLLVDNSVDQATSTLRLKASFPNEDEKLWPGDFVNARLLVETRKDVIAVPSSAVQRGPQGLFTWIVTGKNTAEPRPIEAGPTSGNLTIITSGVSGGERVVTDGQYKLQRGVPVSFGGGQTAAAAETR
jgi:multidrug efflux system membrane fusion protein